MVQKLLVCMACIALLVSVITYCGDNGIFGPIGPSHSNSPEDPVLLELAREFAEEEGVDKPKILFYEGPLEDPAADFDFVRFLQDTLSKYDRVDFTIIFAEDIDLLRDKGWIEPFPSNVNEGNYRSEALEALKRNGTLYAIPIFMKEQEQKEGEEEVRTYLTSTK